MEPTRPENAQDRASQEIQEEPKDALTEFSLKLQVMEYRTLRREELRRIELHYSSIRFLLTGFAAILAFGIQFKLSTVLFLYPFLMLWLALLWRQNADMLTRVREYIATHIEDQEHQWERMLKARFHSIWNYNVAIKFLFICSDLIMLGIGILQSPQSVGLIIVSSLCTLIAAFLLFVRIPNFSFEEGGNWIIEW